MNTKPNPVEDRSVRAVVMSAPGEISVKEMPYPQLQDGAVLLKMKLSGVCGTDKHTFRGETEQYAGTDHHRKSKFPLICGHENVGIVSAIGGEQQVLDGSGTPLKIGDRVVPAPNIACGNCYYCRSGFPYSFCEKFENYGNSLWAGEKPYLLGGWSEYLYLFPGTKMFRVPEELPDEVAVLTEEMAVTHGLDTARLITQLQGQAGFGMTTVIYGVGPLGLCHVIKAKLTGSGKIIALDRMQSRLDMAQELGADVLINVDETDEAARIERIRAETGGHGADVIAHCTGVPAPLKECIQAGRTGAVVIEAGAFVDLGPIPFNPNADLCAKSVTLIGVGSETLSNYEPALSLMAKNLDAIPFDKIVTHQMSFEKAEEALSVSQSPEAIKVVMNPSI